MKGISRSDWGMSLTKKRQKRAAMTPRAEMMRKEMVELKKPSPKEVISPAETLQNQ